MTDIKDIAEQLREFAAARDWEQFHTPKNLAMALAGAAGELLAEYQWLTPEESTDVMNHPDIGPAVTDELADVAIYLIRLADVLGVDLADAADAKILRNEERFPPGR